MPKLTPISYPELASKLRRAGYVEIRTSRHPVYYLAERNLTIRRSPSSWRRSERDVARDNRGDGDHR